MEKTNKTYEEMSEEDQQKVSAYLEAAFQEKFKWHLKEIASYLNKKQITIEQAIQEVTDKISQLTSSQRGILLQVQPNLLQKWFKDYPTVKKYKDENY